LAGKTEREGGNQVAFYNLKCGAEFERPDVALMNKHILACYYCQHGFEGGKPNEEIPARPFLTGKMRATSVSVVDNPVDLNCKTSNGRYLAIDWKRDAV
jgi:hypothetical protein